MADQEVKTDQESQETTDDQNASRKSGKLKIILIPVIFLVQIVVAYYVVFNVLLEHPNHEEAVKPNKEALKVGQFFEIDDLVINPAESGGRRYLVVELALETTNTNLLEEARSKEIWIRDAVITLLTQKTTEELLETTARTDLKKQILATLNAKMLEGRFERLYFKKYILQ